VTSSNKPVRRPDNPRFSSGPCTKHKGWSLDALSGALLGRNHRQADTKGRIAEALDRTRALLRLPDDYRIALVPASDTGAVEMALWNLLGPRGVDVLAWEAFSADWVTDIVDELKLSDVRVLEAPYGELPDLSQVDFTRDVVFAWNGTTSGVRVPNADWISEKREGLTICDGTSAVFAQDMDWGKLDVTTYSWQKVLGGEAQHGMLILSPRAVERFETYAPPWPMPKLFRLAADGKLMRSRVPMPMPRSLPTGLRGSLGSTSSPSTRRRAPTPPSV
jgi:phosphoserine aminotransferase